MNCMGCNDAERRVFELTERNEAQEQTIKTYQSQRDDAVRGLAEVREMNERQRDIIEAHEREIERTKRELGELQRQSQEARNAYRHICAAADHRQLEQSQEAFKLRKQIAARDKAITALMACIQLAAGIEHEEEDEDFDEVDQK